jgi:hypothetical protein
MRRKSGTWVQRQLRQRKDGTLVQKQLFPWLTRRRGGSGAAEKEVYGNSENNQN